MAQQALKDEYLAVVPIAATQTFRPGRNSDDGDLTAGVLLVSLVDQNGNAVTASPSSSTATASSLAATTASQQLVAANAARKGIVINNTSAATAYLTFGATSASAANAQVTIPAGSSYQPPINYLGAYQLALASGTGAVNVTQFT